jgi:hypothetical protein
LPWAGGGRVEIERADLKPYVELTLGLMERFGVAWRAMVDLVRDPGGAGLRVPR